MVFHGDSSFIVLTSPFVSVKLCRSNSTFDDSQLAASKMAKSKKKLEVVHLVCEETGDYNYTLRRKSGGEKLKLKKYSPRLRRRTLHVEKKK